MRDDDWYLVGRGKVGIGYVFAELLEPWVATPDGTLDEALSQEQAPAAEAEDVAEVELSEVLAGGYPRVFGAFGAHRFHHGESDRPGKSMGQIVAVAARFSCSYEGVPGREAT